MAKEFAKCLPERHHSRSQGSYRLGLIQLASLIYGHDCLEDLEEFRDDPYLEEYLKGRGPAPRTMLDFLADFEDEHIEKLKNFLPRLANFIRDHFKRALPAEHKPAELLHTSIDSTSHEQHGKKIEGCAYNYQSKWCLDSQVVFDEMGLAREFALRPGNTQSGKGAARQIRSVFNNETQDWRAHVSGDSAYALRVMFLECTRLKLSFTFTAHESRTPWRKHLKGITNWKCWEYSADDIATAKSKDRTLPEIEVGSFNWYPSWAGGKLCFPMAVKRERVGVDTGRKNQQQLGLGIATHPNIIGEWKYYAVVTNMSLFKHTPQEVIERHNKRGNCENFIREEKYGYDLKHFPCLKLRANYAYGLLALIAHNILRWVAVIERPHRPHFAKKLRRRFLYRAGKLVTSARKTILKVRANFKAEVDRLKKAWTAPPIISCPAPG